MPSDGKPCFSVVSEWRETFCKQNYLAMVIRGSGSRKVEITKNVQWPHSFSEIDMKLIRTHLHWCGENFQKISCRYRHWSQSYSNFNNEQFLLFESIYIYIYLNIFIYVYYNCIHGDWSIAPDSRGSNPPATISGLQMKNFRIIGFISGTQIHGKMKYHLRWLPDKTQIKINYVKLSLNNKMNFSACLTH